MSSPRIWGTILLCLSSMLWFQSCRKSDISATKARQNNEEKFFTAPASTPGTVKRIAAFIKEQNTQHKFIEKVIQKEGYVFWDKADLYIGKLPNRTTIDTLVMLPMVLENTKQVNSFLACKVSGDKISIFLHRGRRYNFYNLSDKPELLTANNLTMELMYLNKKFYSNYAKNA